MRLLAIALLATAACAPAGPRVPDQGDDGAVARRGRADLDAARELDQEGVRAFREGRFADAIRYFRAAYRIGGPSSELWNIARSRERMDDAEGAAGAIEQYLAQRDLGQQDRAEAERELGALRSRSSVLTVTTVPPGAVVMLDGKQAAGPTPVTLEIRPGAHTLAVHRDGYATATRPLDARFGRAVIVSLELARQGGESR
jgi:outer membrane receptor for ferrienterochelin and colicins